MPFLGFKYFVINSLERFGPLVNSFFARLSAGTRFLGCTLGDFNGIRSCSYGVRDHWEAHLVGCCWLYQGELWGVGHIGAGLRLEGYCCGVDISRSIC
jgi:hypothetical protein